MPIQEKNFWATTVDAPVLTPSRAFPDAVDVAIVGGGFCGLSAARTLAKRGVNVAVLEGETFGWGASSRNGGMVLTGMKLPVPTLIKRYGRDTVRKMYAASLETIDCVEQIVREEKIECNFSRCGHLEVACKQRHFDGYEESAALVKREFNHELRIISKSELRTEIGSDIYFGGMVDETSAGVNPARYVAGLAQAAQRAGACLHDHTRVTSVESETNNAARKFRLQTSRGVLTAREVVLASGAYTTEATPALRKKIIPIGSYIIATESLPADLARELSPRNRMIYDSKHFLYYYRLTPDHRMLFGGRAAFFPETENTVRHSAEILRRGMFTVYPQLRDVKVEFVWGGTLDFTLDVMPHAGKIDGMYFATGFAGHGVAAATWFGAKLAGLICGEPNDIPFEGIPFRGAPPGLQSGNTWALPLAGVWYKILDVLT
ncbi:MAG TPA: FAD-binding oxidoreductase [Candidatus Acidoferrum sp.]|jgi:glycine/D-amino acid oxidase-like deaminating enzyme|nr:FAD-binding oxidoreductase [Candidatus Acidoferrum sp.]